MKKFVLLVSLLLIPLTLASETQRRFRIFVHVFEAKQSDLYDTYTRDFLETKLKKEFRSLEDVDIVDVDENTKFHLTGTLHFKFVIYRIHLQITQRQKDNLQSPLTFLKECHSLISKEIAIQRVTDPLFILTS